MPQIPEQLIEKYKEELKECKETIDKFTGVLDDEQVKAYGEFLIKQDILEKHIEVLEQIKALYDVILKMQERVKD